MRENEDLKSALYESQELEDAEIMDVDDEVDVDDNVDEGKKTSAWRELTKEDGRKLSFKDLLFGDYLAASFFRNNIMFVLFVAVLAILYISNRYAAQQEIIEEEKWRKTLVETKNYALTRCAELTMMTRHSSIERRLKAMGDTTLRTPPISPFYIHLHK